MYLLYIFVKLKLHKKHAINSHPLASISAACTWATETALIVESQQSNQCKTTASLLITLTCNVQRQCIGKSLCFQFYGNRTFVFMLPCISMVTKYYKITVTNAGYCRCRRVDGNNDREFYADVCHNLKQLVKIYR